MRHNSYTLSKLEVSTTSYVYNMHYDVFILFYSMEVEFLKPSYSVDVVVIRVLQQLLKEPVMHWEPVVLIAEHTENGKIEFGFYNQIVNSLKEKQ